jgi:hypothetical protein
MLDFSPGLCYSYHIGDNVLKINPEILSSKATHTLNGVKVKVFSQRNGSQYRTAEFMEGPDKGKWTSVTLEQLVEIKE